jgi:alpha-aminoadipate/glutamate carrier protein LysW
MTACPVCEAVIDVPADSRISEIMECADCLNELEIIAVAPPMLALAPEVEEDWGE